MNTTLEREACATGGSVAAPDLDWLAAERMTTNKWHRVSDWLQSGSWVAIRTWLESPRGRRIVGVTAAAQVALVVVFALVYQPFDLAIYLWGGHAVTHGAELYLQQSQGNWYTYPPFAAALFTPLAALPAVLVRVLWELASIGALAWACALTLKLAGQRPTRIVVLALAAAALVLEPMYHTLFLGQVNLFLLALVLADIWRAARGRPAGIGIGIATAIKLTPGIFIVLLLLTRRTRDAVTAALTFGCCTAIGFLVDPSASRMYWTHLFYDTRRVSGPYISNQSPYGALTRLFDGAAHVGTWYYVIPVVLGGLGLAVAAVQARQGDWLAAAAVTGVTGLLVSPISWTHHWVWALPALVVLARGGRASRIALACASVVFVLAPMWFTPHLGGGGDYGDRGFVTVIANCFLIAGLAFLLHMTVLTVRARRSYAVEAWIPPIDSRYADVSASAPARMVVAK
ncbi:MAG TPA: glycosyltransferase 87 family protein [Streptosporangiaceae bacterium]